MRSLQACAGMALLFLFAARTYANIDVSLKPLNPCPVANHYCRARAAEAGLPRDYPTRVFLENFEAQCSQKWLRSMAQRVNGILSPSFGPRLCRLMGHFLGATPAEWRAVVISQMRTGHLKTTPVGQQITRQMKAGMASFLRAAEHRTPTPFVNAPAAMHEAPIASASRLADVLVARRLRAVRVAMERGAVRRTGSPLPLATGSCQAELSLSPRGRVKQMSDIHCSNLRLQTAFSRAILDGGPLRILPSVRPYHVIVRVFAPLAEPGLHDGFTR